jgi:hypothetical protein
MMNSAAGGKNVTWDAARVWGRWHKSVNQARAVGAGGSELLRNPDRMGELVRTIFSALAPRDNNNEKKKFPGGEASGGKKFTAAASSKKMYRQHRYPPPLQRA